MSPTVATLTKLADALDEPLSRLFEETDTSSPVVRLSDRMVIEQRGVVDALVSRSRNGRLEVSECTIEPGADNGGAAYTHWGAEECIIIVEGSLQFWLADEPYLLTRGDAITFSSSIPHRWHNPTREITRATWILTR